MRLCLVGFVWWGLQQGCEAEAPSLLPVPGSPRTCETSRGHFCPWGEGREDSSILVAINTSLQIENAGQS